MRLKRVGIFGGTFDPPHLGHSILAEEIRERFGLDEVYFMPCNEPPHKNRADLTEAKHRFAMVVAATLHNPAFVASPIEVNRPGKSYSVDTVKQLSEAMGDGVSLSFFTGLDAFLEIETWKGFEQLLDYCHMIVVSRPGHSFDGVKQLPAWIVERGVDLRDAEDEALPPSGDDGKRVFLLDAVHIDISSTDIRERVRGGQSVRYRVSAEVERYIRANGLYQADNAVRRTAS